MWKVKRIDTRGKPYVVLGYRLQTFIKHCCVALLYYGMLGDSCEAIVSSGGN
ncbi:hypothetical protein BH10BAC2_BH10BAC2_33170 [soil metagenome]